MARPTAMDDYFVHQIPELLPNVVTRNPHWRESYFFEMHRPDAAGDVVFFTMAHYPATERMDSLQMGKVAGQPVLGLLQRDYGGDPHTTDVGGARVQIVEPMKTIRLWADPEVAAIGLDVTFAARTQAYGLRRGTMRAGDDVVWDQSHIFQSGVYEGTYTAAGQTHRVDGWIGQRDHSWGIRDHDRCPLWIWFQIQLDDGFLAVWHWELANGTRIYTDGCWAGADGSDPVPVIDFAHRMEWTGPGGDPADYGKDGGAVAGLRGSCTFTIEGGRRVEVEATGTFDRPYEPFHRGGLSQMKVATTDGRTGSAIYEITGARHHRYFPDTDVTGRLPG
ncbi:MAG TPA: hypothetical protein VG435_05300 [Acidimicrobiales bacterium]|jgi:hypothetical protein|nr:hypothetical protein [Acidimicrobiales bacterium]